MSEITTLDVLDALADGAVHSGEGLAARFGITRSALAKRVDKLRDWGLDVQAQAGSGYQLASPFERLDAAQINAGLSAEARAMGLQLAVLTRTDSTNSQLLAADAADDPQALFAEYQTAGRGRRGREWLSPFGASLMFSLAYSFAAWPARLTTLPLACAVVLARVVAELGVNEVQIKWPNDLQVAGKKLAGILIEPRGETGGACRVVVGVGLNWNLSPEQAQNLSQPWLSLHTALQELGRPLPGRNALAAALISELAVALKHFEAHGFAPYAAEWRARDALMGKPVRVEGAEAFEGIASGINADGGLLITTAEGSRAVHAGDVSVRTRA